jgi:hypothetical protein
LIILLGLKEMLVSAEGVNFRLLMYYTLQSNALALVLFAMLAYRTAKGLRLDGIAGSAGYFSRFEMVCSVDLLLTLAVFWVLLAPSMFSMDGDSYLWSFRNLSVHLFAPIFCVVDYILFSDSRSLKYQDAYYVVIFPLIYLLFSIFAGLSGYVYRQSADDGGPVRFPYFFFDFDRIGAKSLIYIFGLIIFFLLVSHGFYFVDRKIRRPRGNSQADIPRSGANQGG